GGPYIVADPKIGAEDVALEIGAAETEVGIDKGVERGIRLQEFVGGIDVPVAKSLDVLVADGDARHPSLVAAIERTDRVARRVTRHAAAVVDGDTGTAEELAGPNVGQRAIERAVPDELAVDNDVIGIELGEIDLRTGNHRP